MVINLIANNFEAYRKTPIYVNLDAYVDHGRDLDDLEMAGGSIIKTHFPQSHECDNHHENIMKFLMNKKVIICQRDPEGIRNSMRNFGSWGRQEVNHFDEHFVQFRNVWDNFPNSIRVTFEEMVDPSGFSRLVDRIAEFLDQPIPQNPLGPRPKCKRISVLQDKALTRLLGGRAPRINTGIRLGQ